MSIFINKDTKVITQGITGKTGQFHTEKCQEYANGKNCFVAGVNPKKAGERIFDIPIFGSVKDAAKETGATVSVIYVPPAGAAAAIWEAVEADLDLAICITEGIPVRDMLEVRNKMRAKGAAGGAHEGHQRGTGQEDARRKRPAHHQRRHHGRSGSKSGCRRQVRSPEHVHLRQQRHQSHHPGHHR